MSVFGLIHGSWHGAWCWDKLIPELEQRGHSAIAVDLPSEDWDAGYEAQVGLVVDALADAGDDVVLVGHSLGATLLPVVPSHRPVRQLVYLCPLVVRPGRALDDVLDIEPHTFTARWRSFPRTVHQDGAVTWEPGPAIKAFYHDCDLEVARWAAGQLRRQVWTISRETCPVDTWPDTEYALIYGADDRVVSAAWAEDVAREVLEVEPVELPGGHSPMLARPAELADALVRLASAVPADA
jgi:pimeloyl-ACP methyl ester carboxylesterase